MKLPINHQNILNSEILKIFSNENFKITGLNKDNSGDVINNIVKEFYFNPWARQETIFKNFNISQKKELIALNSIIRANTNIQNLIKKKGPARKYWNTILPFTERIEDVLNDTFRAPLRIALFPGLSCMFFCGFCGRNQKAKYPTDIVSQSVKNIKKIFEMSEKNTKISISGGLEPLTNTKINEIIHYSSLNKLRIPLITNGYNLSKNFIEKNQNLMNLDSIRISLYGWDEDSYFYITRNKKGFHMVKQNLIELIKQRNIFNKNLKIGLNFIILRENMFHLNKIIDFIKMINESVGVGSGINFLSLRDDYHSVTGNNNELDTNRIYRTEGRIEDDYRKKLMYKIEELNEYKKKMCNDLHIDYGYSLEFLSQGFFDVGLKKIKANQLRVNAFTQLSVAVDTFGDVFLFREAGFLNRQGNKKMIIGRIDDKNDLEKIIKKFLKNGNKNSFKPDDIRFLDSFDHVLASMVYQKEQDLKFGVKLNQSPIQNENFQEKKGVGNNWYFDDI